MDTSRVEKGYADILAVYDPILSLYRVCVYQSPWGRVTASRWMLRSDANDTLAELGCSSPGEMLDAAQSDTGVFWPESEAIETVVF